MVQFGHMTTAHRIVVFILKCLKFKMQQLILM